jgi:hypothetical protein
MMFSKDPTSDADQRVQAWDRCKVLEVTIFGYLGSRSHPARANDVGAIIITASASEKAPTFRRYANERLRHRDSSGKTAEMKSSDPNIAYRSDFVFTGMTISAAPHNNRRQITFHAGSENELQAAISISPAIEKFYGLARYGTFLTEKERLIAIARRAMNDIRVPEPKLTDINVSFSDISFVDSQIAKRSRIVDRCRQEGKHLHSLTKADLFDEYLLSSDIDVLERNMAKLLGLVSHKQRAFEDALARIHHEIAAVYALTSELPSRGRIFLPPSQGRGDAFERAERALQRAVYHDEYTSIRKAFSDARMEVISELGRSNPRAESDADFQARMDRAAIRAIDHVHLATGSYRDRDGSLKLDALPINYTEIEARRLGRERGLVFPGDELVRAV